MLKRHRRSYIYILAILMLGFLLSGIGYATDNPLPAKYPEEWGVLYMKATTPTVASFPTVAHGAFNGFNPGTTVYKKGTVFYEGGPELPCDIIKDRDISVTMRDGAKIYVDIFRPAGATEKLPAIICWDAYGKSTPRKPISEIPAGEGTSGLAMYEGPDPGYYCNHGYAVVNVDSRGVNMSEGNIHYWGMVESGDGYDLIEWIAEQDWSNGKVGMAGLSWPGISQWYIAATRPPHLTAIAPWAAHFFDQYSGDVCVGGIPTTTFNKIVTEGLTGVTDGLMGHNLVEQPYAMVEKYPLMHPYWEDKIAKIENIDIPVYTFCGYSGDLEGGRELLRRGHPQTWIYIGQRGSSNDIDLLRFFDRYLKGIENGWETTPKVRLMVQDPVSIDQLNRPESSWPLPQTVYRQLYLDSSKGTLSAQPATTSSTARYNAKEGETAFKITFQEDTELTGYMKLVLWVEADGADDMDIFVTVQKVDVQGNSYRATGGQQRVSLRALDPEKSTSYMPVPSFRKREPLSKEQIVPVEIAIQPLGMVWHAGEQLLLTLGGDRFGINDTNIRFGTSDITHSYNRGYHIIHTGPQYPSYLQVPVIP
jgi:predicted acyl esterase